MTPLGAFRAVEKITPDLIRGLRSGLSPGYRGQIGLSHLIVHWTPVANVIGTRHAKSQPGTGPRHTIDADATLPFKGAYARLQHTHLDQTVVQYLLVLGRPTVDLREEDVLALDHHYHRTDVDPVIARTLLLAALDPDKHRLR